jgi:multidrug efflux pump subunit AcrB
MATAFALRSGGMAAWSIRHPIGVSMIALALVALGVVALVRLGVDLLPRIIYPEIGIRIVDSGVPAAVMEDRITRQLEEQLAITENAISVQSRTSEGRSSVELAFPYGTDIDIALRDASTRLDRAKRLLPESIDPPIIFKRDPSQLPVIELAVSSALRDAVELRTWVDYQLARWFLTLPGVAATEVGGGLEREIHILPDILRLHALNLGLNDLIDSVRAAHVDMPMGRLETSTQYTSVRLPARFETLTQLNMLPLRSSLNLQEVATVRDAHADERLRIRFKQVPGIKMSIQKQPQANTVAVADAVHERLAWLYAQGMIPPDIHLDTVSDQSIYVRTALKNALIAVLGGALLAMLVVFIFLGDWRRTLVIGSAIPIALMVTFILMDLLGLTLNIMTLGGLAVGVGMLVDSAIVMLENIARHQHDHHSNAIEADETEQNDHPHTKLMPAINAATEINSAIVASTSTNLAAVLPFLFIGGLTGLLFRELIITIAAAMIAAMLIALTLVPALAAQLNHPIPIRHGILGYGARLIQRVYIVSLRYLLRWPLLLIVVFIVLFGLSVPVLQRSAHIFLPPMDEGLVQISVTADRGIAMDRMDEVVQDLEVQLLAQPEVVSVYTQVGGAVFGRSTQEATHRSSVTVQLVPPTQRQGLSADAWIQRMNQSIKRVPGVEVRLRTQGIRGIRLSQGDDDLSIRVQGPDLDTLAHLGSDIVSALQDIEGLRNPSHSYESIGSEIAVTVDRVRAAALGFHPREIADSVGILLGGRSVGDFIEHDRAFDIRVRLPRYSLNSPADLHQILLRNNNGDRVRLGDIAHIGWITSPAEIVRDQQQRIVEISASLAADAALSTVLQAVATRLAEFPLPPGYLIYDGGTGKTLQEGQRMSEILLVLAIFLVFVVMAVQYESLRDPLVILLGIPFAICGVAAALYFLKLPLSMPVWLGMIMLAGMVVNNTIVLVETIEIQKQQGLAHIDAIVTAAGLRLRPICMTTLSTVAGLMPLALGLGQGSEMLQPLAITIVCGLSFSLLVSLGLVPMIYKIMRG